jgi:dCMP deaminase
VQLDNGEAWERYANVLDGADYANNHPTAKPDLPHLRYLALAERVAQHSTDLSTKTGCVIVGDGHVKSLDFNDFPRGCKKTDERMQRPAKYLWTEHSERNAIANAAYCGTSLKGCTLYSTWFPCAECARMIIQCGISTVVGYEPDLTHPKYGEEFKVALQMFEEGGVTVVFVGTKEQKQK